MEYRSWACKSRLIWHRTSSRSLRPMSAASFRGSTIPRKPRYSNRGVRLRCAPVFFEEVRDGADAVVIVPDVVLLIRGMQTVVRQAESHQDRRDAEVRGEVADDGD